MLIDKDIDFLVNCDSWYHCCPSWDISCYVSTYLNCLVIRYALIPWISIQGISHFAGFFNVFLLLFGENLISAPFMIKYLISSYFLTYNISLYELTLNTSMAMANAHLCSLFRHLHIIPWVIPWAVATFNIPINCRYLELDIPRFNPYYAHFFTHSWRDDIKLFF